METLAPYKSTLGAYNFVLMVGHADEVIHQKAKRILREELNLGGEKRPEL